MMKISLFRVSERPVYLNYNSTLNNFKLIYGVYLTFGAIIRIIELFLRKTKSYYG